MNLFFLLLTFSLKIFACPTCAGGVSASKTPWTLIILGSFIVFCYIPLFILFRSAKKYDPSRLDGTN